MSESAVFLGPNGTQTGTGQRFPLLKAHLLTEWDGGCPCPAFPAVRVSRNPQRLSLTGTKKGTGKTAFGTVFGRRTLEGDALYG